MHPLMTAGGCHTMYCDPRVLLKQSLTLSVFATSCRYAAAQIERLIALSVGHVHDSSLQQLQTMLEDCDKHGSADADISADEDTATFPEIVRAASDSAEVFDFVDALLRS